MLKNWPNEKALLWPPVERKQQVGECWVCVIFFPRLVARAVRCTRCSRGVTGGAAPPPVGVRGSAPKNFFWGAVPLIGGPTHGFVHGFAHGFGVRWFSAPGIL